MIPSKIKHKRNISSLCFGTVQLGLPYGIANNTGMPDENTSSELLITAANAGVSMFDTARDYGKSEERLGKAISKTPKTIVMTKLSPLTDLASDLTEEIINKKIEESVNNSLKSLKLSSLPYLSLHRAEHLHTHNGKIWQKLLYLREQGLIERLGVSVQTPQEALAALQNSDVESIQLPFNILDRRYENFGILELFAKRPEVLVIARSALLQGLLTKNACDFPIISSEEAADITSALDRFVIEFERKNRVDLCLAFVRSQSWIDSVVVGMENKAQLQENLEMFQSPVLSEDSCNIIRKKFSDVNEALLNPALWPKKASS